MSVQMSEADDHVLLRYVLGWLPEDESDRLDEASIEDDEVAARLRIVEQELVDDYVRGALPRDVAARFESYYLTSARRRHRVRSAEAFLRALDRVAANNGAPLVRRSLGGRIIRIASIAAALVLAIASAVAIGIRWPRASEPAVSSVSVAVDRLPQVEAGRPAGLDQSDNAPPDSARRPRLAPALLATPSIALVLSPQTRGVEPLAMLPRTDQPVAFELQTESAQFAQYSVTLKDPFANRAIWRSGTVRSRTATTGTSVTVVIPAGLLRAQRYWIELSGSRDRIHAAEVVDTYAFLVTPQ